MVLNNEKILITGGCGFIGHHLAIALKKLCQSVTVVDNLSVNHFIDHINHPLYRFFLEKRMEKLHHARIDIRYSDVTCFESLSKLYHSLQPTKIIHLAGLSSAIKAEKNPEICFDTQLLTLRHFLAILRGCPQPHPQILFASSSTVYGHFSSHEVDELTPLAPEGIYATTKMMGEQLLQLHYKRYGIGYTIIRPSALYGSLCTGQRVSQKFFENALYGKPIILENGGSGRLDFTYIDDLIHGITQALIHYRSPQDSQILNMTYGNAQPISELIPVLKKFFHTLKIETVDCDPTLRPIRGTLSITKARNLIHYNPQWNLQEGYAAYCRTMIAIIQQWNKNPTNLHIPTHWLKEDALIVGK